MLLFFTSCNLPSKDTSSAVINLIIDDDNSSAVSVTGKELLWSKSQVKWKNSAGLIRFVAEVKGVDLLVIKTNKTYKSFTCYLEENQELNVVYREHQYSITGNSLAARQNRLLVSIHQQRNSALVNRKDSTYAQWAENTHKEIEQIIDEFIDANEDASPNFIQYVRFDNRYYFLTQELGIKSTAPLVYHKYTPEELEVMHEVIKDSDYDLAYLSTHYRILLNNYMDYVRLFDKEYISQTTDNPITNEWLLASRLKSKELQQYQMAVSLTKILQIDCNLDLPKAIKDYTGYWSSFLLDQHKLVSKREYIKHSINPNSTYTIQSPLIKSNDSVLSLNEFQGEWVYLGIGANGLGYSPYEASHLDNLNAHLPQLKCLCISTYDKIGDDKSYDFIQLIYTKPEKLEKAFETPHLPYSMLINPAGEIVCVNLPRASSGILEPMLLNMLNQN